MLTVRPSRFPPGLSLSGAPWLCAPDNTIGILRAHSGGSQHVPSVLQLFTGTRRVYGDDQQSSCSSSERANQAVPLAAELASMLRSSVLLGEQHADARHGARGGAHHLALNVCEMLHAARRHRDMRRERRVSSVRALALIRVASLMTRAASKHSLESSGTGC